MDACVTMSKSAWSLGIISSLFIHAGGGIETFVALTFYGHFQAGCSNQACSDEESTDLPEGIAEDGHDYKHW